MKIRDRIKEFRRVKAEDLLPNPDNWRLHPESQVAHLRTMFADIGVIDAVLAFPADGKGPEGDFSKLMLFDGHLRLEELAGGKVPVLVTDLTREEARKAILTHDPLSAQAETDKAKLEALLKAVDTENDEIEALLAEFARENGLGPAAEGEPTELKPITVQPPPKMTWVLIGIPTVRFGEISETVERIAHDPTVIVETTSNDGPKD